MADLENGIILYWAVAVTIILAVLVVMVVRLRQKHMEDIEELTKDQEAKRALSKTLGRSEIRGELNQILGSYALLNEYQHLAFLTSVAKQFPLDLIGVKEDSIDFIEIKSLRTRLTENDKTIKKLIDEKKVGYKVMEGNLPKSFEINERED